MTWVNFLPGKHCFLLFLFFSIPGSQAVCQQQNTLNLEGKWYIHYSDFPMWQKGNKQKPTFNYIYLDKGRMLDQVKFEKKGKIKTITGTDKPLNEERSCFQWRGQGLLFVVKSRWSVHFADPESQWAVISFEKTLFTPAGYDLISREKVLPVEIREQMKEQLEKLIPGHSLSEISQD